MRSSLAEFKDRRKATRSSVRWPVLLEFSNGCSWTTTGVLRDMSAYGAYVYAHTEVPLGKALLCMVFVPGGDEVLPVRFTGSVVRVDALSSGYGVALSFSDLDFIDEPAYKLAAC